MPEPNQPANDPGETSLYRSMPEGPGAKIGPYKLLQEIGEGGFGKVYMAEQQEPVRRKVALKIIKPGMDTKEVIARFESERQALALMDHPNIARVLDAGATDTGRPFFVMELVRGVPITEYCDKNSLTTGERLELFVTVCRAVQHAHQKGVIHRDLKPSNVMVTLHDGQPVPKVIDFGVAKATTQKLTERTMFTAYGQMIGTPAYMSPEQAEMSGLDIDTRSDIYSLGVVLYELLTGTTPFELKRLRDASYIEMQRIIREEDPPKPSTRISTLGDSLTVIANHRRTDPAKLRQALSGDLDLIVMKALEKERGRRYETPNSFAQDIERFLRHEAIHARPQSTVYRLRKFAERNKAAVATALAVGICLLLGTIVSSILAIQAVRARDRAQESLLAAQEAKLSEESQRKLADERRAEAETARNDAEQQRDAAQKAKLSEEDQRKKAEAARQSEAELRIAADQKRADIERQKVQIDGLNTQLTGVLADQRRTLYTAQMNHIHKAWETDNVARVLELLDAQRPKPGETDLRGFEWHYWNRLCNNDLHTLKLPISIESGLAFTMAGRTIEFSPDGTRLAALYRPAPQARNAGTVKLWDLQSGDEILSLPIPSAPAQSPPSAAGAQPSSPASANADSSVFWGRWLLFIDSQHLGVVTPEPSRGRAPPEYTELTVYNIATKVVVYKLREPTIGAFIVSADGTKVAALVTDYKDQDGQALPAARIWDAKTGEVSAEVSLPGGPWATLTISRDGTNLATSTMGLSVTLASAQQATGEAAEVAKAMASRVFNVKIWDVASGQQQAEITDFAANTLEFSPNGRQIAVIGTARNEPRVAFTQFSARISLHDASSGANLWSRPLENLSSANLARPEFSHDGQWVCIVRDAVMPHDRSLGLLNAATGAAAPLLKGHTAPLVGVAFLADGHRVRTAASDGTIKTWEAPQPAKSEPEPSSMRPAFDVQTIFSPDGTRQASVPVVPRSGSVLSMQESSTNGVLWKQDQSAGIEQFAFSQDGKLVAASWSVDPMGAGPATGHIRVWDAATGKEIRTLPKTTPRRGRGLATTERLRLGPDFALDPTGKGIAISSINATSAPASWRIQVVDIASGRELVIGEAIPGAPSQLEFSPSGKRILAEVVTTVQPPANAKAPAKTTTTTQLHLVVLDAATGRVAWNLPSMPRMLRFCKDGNRLCGSLNYNLAVVWDMDTGGEVARIPASGAVSMALSPDGKRLGLVAPPPIQSGFNPFDRNRSLLIRVFDVESAAELFRLQGHSGAVSDIVFSNDGRRIATTAGASTETKLWDAETGQELLSLPGADVGLAFTSDDRQLIGQVSAYRIDANVPAFGPTRRTVIANAAAISPESEAKKLVEILTSGRGQALLTRGEICSAIESDGSLGAASRARALELVQGLRREVSPLNSAAWSIARQKDLPRQQYERAAELVTEAIEREPKSLLIWNTRGVANYRAGNYALARADLEQSNQLVTATRRPSLPEDLVFLAMTHQQLGNAKEAAEFLERFRQYIKRSGSTKVREWRDYLSEAHELLDIPVPPPAPTQEIAGWGKTVDPAGDCRFSAAGGALTIDVPGTLHSLAPANNNFDAPRVLQEVEGDFTMQVKVTSSIEPQTPLTDRTIAYFGAGLLAWENSDNFLRIERNGYFLHTNYITGSAFPSASALKRKFSSHAPLVEHIQAGRDLTAGRNPFNATAPLLPGPATWLRLVRRGPNIEIFLSHDGQMWKQVPRVETRFPNKVSLGVIARNNSGSEFHAEFSDLVLTRP